MGLLSFFALQLDLYRHCHPLCIQPARQGHCGYGGMKAAIKNNKNLGSAQEVAVWF